MIDMYMEEASSPMFLSGFFQSPARNFHTQEMVVVDVERDEEEVAVAIQDLSTGPRQNVSSQFTSKEFAPPIFDEEGVLTAFNMIKRRPGVNPFEDVNFAAAALEDSFKIFRKLEKKIRRAIELQASQVLQTGTLTLVDGSGSSVYSLNFAPKATHFPTAGTAWGTTGYTPLADLESLAAVVRQDGKRDPNRLVFGSRAFQDFVANTDVQARFDSRGMNFGVLAPETRGKGATFQGYVWIGHYRFEVWTYNESYKHPATGVQTSYLNQDSVVMLSDSSRLDLTYGAIPMIRPVTESALPFLPPRISSVDGGLDLTTNAWFSADGKRLHVSAGTRPLCIPTAIDTIGRLKTR